MYNIKIWKVQIPCPLNYYSRETERTHPNNNVEFCWKLCCLLIWKLKTKQTFKVIPWRAKENTGLKVKPHTLSPRIEITLTAILCICWFSWLQSHWTTNLAATNLRFKNILCFHHVQQFLSNYLSTNKNLFSFIFRSAKLFC